MKLPKDQVDEADLFTWGTIAVPFDTVKEACAAVGVKVEVDNVDSDADERNKPGMVVAVHIDAGDFVKFREQVYEVEETEFDDHDVTLWFVGGFALKCAAGCLVEVVPAPGESNEI